jgi:two-component system nitrate/nitrite response regulator NarL
LSGSGGDSSDQSQSGQRALRIVLIAENQRGIAGVLRALDDSLTVVGLATTAGAGVAMAMALRPALVLLLPAPSASPEALIERLTDLVRGPRVLVLASASGGGVVAAIRAGASGYVDQGLGPVELRRALHAAASGECPISPAHSEQLFAYVRGPGGAASRAGEARPLTTRLSPRELEVLRLLPRGESNAEIGQALGLSEHTVRNHVASILDKLRLENRVQAAVKAVRSGLACFTVAEIVQLCAQEGDLLGALAQVVGS